MIHLHQDWAVKDARQVMHWYREFLPQAPLELYPFLGLEDCAFDESLSQGALREEDLRPDLLLQRTIGTSGRSNQRSADDNYHRGCPFSFRWFDRDTTDQVTAAALLYRGDCLSAR